MDITFTDGGRYIPKWRGNDELIDAEKIIVDWVYPSIKERNEIKYITSLRYNVSKAKVSNEIEFVTDRQKLVEICVQKIAGLRVNGQTITTGAELVAAKGCGELFDELAVFLLPKIEIPDTEKKT
jgi:hypothetical protein